MEEENNPIKYDCSPNEYDGQVLASLNPENFSEKIERNSRSQSSISPPKIETDERINLLVDNQRKQ